MDPSNVYPDVLGEALSHSSQRLAQLASLVTGGAMLEARRRAQRNASKTVRKQRELKALQDQERAAYQMARAGWAPAHDSRWLAQADLLQAFRAWSAATAYADADPSAASSARRCEERLRVLHPYAMAWYDRLRSEGAGAFDAMRQALPLFDRAPHPRPGRQAGERRVLPPSAGPDGTSPDDGPHDDGPRPRPDGDGWQVERRGIQIVRELQARALAERGYTLSRDELVTTLGATTTLTSDIIGRLAHADSEGRIAAGAEQARAGHLDSAAAARQDELNANTAPHPRLWRPYGGTTSDRELPMQHHRCRHGCGRSATWIRDTRDDEPEHSPARPFGMRPWVKEVLMNALAQSPVFWVGLIAGLALIYFLPTIIAMIRRVESPGWVIFLNVLPTGVGWLAAMVVAFMMPRREPAPTCLPYQYPPPGYAHPGYSYHQYPEVPGGSW